MTIAFFGGLSIRSLDFVLIIYLIDIACSDYSSKILIDQIDQKYISLWILAIFFHFFYFTVLSWLHSPFRAVEPYCFACFYYFLWPRI